MKQYFLVIIMGLCVSVIHAGKLQQLEQDEISKIYNFAWHECATLHAIAIDKEIDHEQKIRTVRKRANILLEDVIYLEAHRVCNVDNTVGPIKMLDLYNLINSYIRWTDGKYVISVQPNRLDPLDPLALDSDPDDDNPAEAAAWEDNLTISWE